MKQEKLFCTATAMDSLVLLHCSIQRRLLHCLKQKRSFPYSGAGCCSSIQQEAGISWASACTCKWKNHPKCI
uniref:Uncharacterized protein n=1 Tax=Arundo donax TaxID=35708 RepID=A0A0A8YFM5_ARUDO